MHGVIHIVDRDTPLDMQRQLDLLADADETIFSLGPPPEYLAARRNIRGISQPPSFGPLVFRLHKCIDPAAKVVHWWTAGVMTDRLAAPGARIVFSLPALPDRDTPCHPRGILTVPTAGAARELVRRGTPVTNVAVMAPPAAGITGRQARRGRVRNALGLTDGHFLLLAPGEMIRQAGHKYAPWAQTIILQMLPNVRLLMPGGGAYEEHVRYFAANTGRLDEVFFTGDRWDLEDCLSAADAALFLFERDCGIAALAAAMACGLPIVASATPDVVSCAPGGQAALLVPPRSPRLAAAEILKLIDDPQLAHRLADNARRRAAELFDIEQSRHARLAIYSGQLPLP